MSNMSSRYGHLAWFYNLYYIKHKLQIALMLLCVLVAVAYCSAADERVENSWDDLKKVWNMIKNMGNNANIANIGDIQGGSRVSDEK